MRTKVISVDRFEELITDREQMEHSRIDDDYDIEIVQANIAAATDLVEKWLNRKLFSTEMVGSIPSFRKRVNIPYPPIHEVTKVTMEDSNGTVTELVSGTDYRFDDISEQVIFMTDQSRYENFKFHYKCGYENRSDIPMSILHAIKQTASTLYENREDTVIGASVSEVPLKTQRLIGAYRVKVVA
jgi:uncharacterized phiE125 gp8 family phage protein